MDLNVTFKKGVDILFKIFKSIVHPATYVLKSNKGWGTDAAAIERTFDVIVNGLQQKDIQETSFAAQYLPDDTIIMAKGSDIAAGGIEIKKSDIIKLTIKGVVKNFSVEAHDTDPVTALYIILLREKP